MHSTSHRIAQRYSSCFISIQPKKSELDPVGLNVAKRRWKCDWNLIRNMSQHYSPLRTKKCLFWITYEWYFIRKLTLEKRAQRSNEMKHMWRDTSLICSCDWPRLYESDHAKNTWGISVGFSMMTRAARNHKKSSYSWIWDPERVDTSTPNSRWIVWLSSWSLLFKIRNWEL